MDKVQILNVEGISHLFVEMDRYLEKSKYLMRLAQDNGLIIQKYYWRSIQDNNYIEYIEPKIYDAFIMCIDIIGDYDKIQYILQEYKKVRKDLSKLSYIEHITQEEIKKYSMKLLSNL